MSETLEKYENMQFHLDGKPIPDFDGPAYDHDRDYSRLANRTAKIYEFMKDGKWTTIHEVSERIQNTSESSVSSAIRDFRKKKFGGHKVEKRYISNGLWEYRLIVNTGEDN